MAIQVKLTISQAKDELTRMGYSVGKFYTMFAVTKNGKTEYIDYTHMLKRGQDLFEQRQNRIREKLSGKELNSLLLTGALVISSM
jgi:hypothetical protein